MRSELTIEPFHEGAPGPHVAKAIRALEEAGFAPEIGPFGTSIEGPAELVHPAIERAAAVAFQNGATIVSTQTVLVRPPDAPDNEAHSQLINALRPVLEHLGANLVSVKDSAPDDLPLVWEGEVVAMVQSAGNHQVAPLHEAVPRLITQIEGDLGSKLANLDREQKQQAARWLEERGAFQLRNSVDLVADAMNVSRVTVYTYLSAMREADGKA